jgi:hypothetical protein
LLGVGVIAGSAWYWRKRRLMQQQPSLQNDAMRPLDEELDESSSYYSNTTGDSISMTAPPKLGLFTSSQQASQKQSLLSGDLPPHWFEYHDSQGRAYYYNSDNGTTQWERPT